MLDTTNVGSSAARVHTCFLCADGELLTGLTLAYGVVGVHADAIDGGRVKVHDVGLIVGGGNIPSCMFELPRI